MKDFISISLPGLFLEVFNLENICPPRFDEEAPAAFKKRECDDESLQSLHRG
jgi:hypothetical protein